MSEYVDDYQQQLIIHPAGRSPALFPFVLSIFFKKCQRIKED